jgi:putrescine aminotransferase
MAHESYADAFFGEEGIEFAHGHSYANNPMTSAAGIAVIDVLTEEKLPEKAKLLGEYLEKKLCGLKSLGVIREIRGKGLLRGVELAKDPQTGKQFAEGSKLGSALKKTAIDNGLIMRIDPDWFAVCPPLISTENDIDELVLLIEKSLKDALDIVC